MPQPDIKPLAVYRIRITHEMIDEGMEIKHAVSSWTQKEKEKYLEGTTQQLIEEIQSAVLIELLITNPDDRYDLIDFHQPGSDQAPYDEVYLTEDGLSVVQTKYSEIPKGNILRVAFFLHYFEPEKPLITSYGQISLPPVQVMPDYLEKLVPYRAAD